MSGKDDDTEKSHEASPQKLREARKKGDIARSNDLSTAAAYGGLLLSLLTFGGASIADFGAPLAMLLAEPDQLRPLFFGGSAHVGVGQLIRDTMQPLIVWVVLPALCVILVILARRGFVVAPNKLQPKVSRISPISNAKNKFGRSGLFEFAKSFAKLLIYSICLALFLDANLDQIVGSSKSGPRQVPLVLADLGTRFLVFVVLVATAIAAVDYAWQRADHLRRHRMSLKELRDEHKEAEGDPMMKQTRRARAQEIALNQMMGDVPKADVVIVNPTHYAVALKWSRKPGEAPVCVAKGVDDVAHRIRLIAAEHSVPIHSDPPTARALFAGTDIGRQIDPGHFRPVAAAIRFAEAMRQKAAREKRFGHD